MAINIITSDFIYLRISIMLWELSFSALVAAWTSLRTSVSATRDGRSCLTVSTRTLWSCRDHPDYRPAAENR